MRSHTRPPELNFASSHCSDSATHSLGAPAARASGERTNYQLAMDYSRASVSYWSSLGRESVLLTFLQQTHFMVPGTSVS